MYGCIFLSAAAAGGSGGGGDDDDDDDVFCKLFFGLFMH